MKITICGSMKFLDEMKEVEHRLFSMGHEVKRPEAEVLESWVADGVRLDDIIWNESEFSDDIKKEAIMQKWKVIQDHYEKIKRADAILVINEPKNWIDGYIWWNTLMEIWVAFYDHKKIYILHGVGDISYTSEILWCGPIILNDDLSLITL